jgi:putative spermidine/putrescine transport system permease protein
MHTSSQSTRVLGLLLVVPALAIITLCFIAPLVASIIGAFQTSQGIGLDNFRKSFALYSGDMVFTVLIVGLSTMLIGACAVAIAGYLTLGEHPRAVAMLRGLYRWPMFIPFIVAGQVARTFLAKNGFMNNALVATGMVAPLDTVSFLDWRGIVITFVWKQTPFVALLLAGAMAAIDRGTIEAARNLGAGRLRILFEIVLPQVAPTLLTGLILSFVTMMSVLSVPLMVAGQSPTLMTVDMAFRISAYRDYGVANALGLVSLVMTALVAWLYLRRGVREHAQ